jgi:GH15 family glucan-1,4-alpha-glucosidase
MASRIEDYALIGDCGTAALVAKNGSIDWLCMPRFDSSACFAALLGTPEHGRWRIATTVAPREIRRRYRDRTLVLETEYETEDGVVALIDCMPLRVAQPRVVRLVEGREGRVAMTMDLALRLEYGSRVPWVRRIDGGIRAVAGPDALRLETPVALRGEGLRTVADFAVSAGERVPFTLTWSRSHVPDPPVEDPGKAIAETEQWWRAWCGHCKYEGEWDQAVTRSLITLKALTYAPTGGIVAAPTTSLPEQLGGVRNWDYRYCWLRDATFTLYALITGGYVEEAAAWRQWLERTVAGSPEQAQIMYGLAGEARLTEIELRHLPGYEGSRPVRIGNAASEQFQLDVYGEVMDALHLARRAGLPLDENAWPVQRALVEFVEKAWQRPDEGIWEVRGSRRHFTHSKVMAWVAMDRAIKAVQRFGEQGPVEHWRKVRAEIHADVCAKGFDPELGSFVQSYGGKLVDASLLLIPLVGFLPARDPRMIGTVKAITEALMHDGFIARYPTHPEVDGLPPGEGAFLACTFWLADNLAVQGRYEEAQEIFERLLALRNDVGLLSEQYDPAARRMVGNFPQAFSHVGLINTARNLARAGGPAEHRRRG